MNQNKKRRLFSFHGTWYFLTMLQIMKVTKAQKRRTRRRRRAQWASLEDEMPPILKLPDECLLMIFQELPGECAASLVFVCLRFRWLIHDYRSALKGFLLDVRYRPLRIDERYLQSRNALFYDYLFALNLVAHNFRGCYLANIIIFSTDNCYVCARVRDILKEQDGFFLELLFQNVNAKQRLVLVSYILLNSLYGLKNLVEKYGTQMTRHFDFPIISLEVMYYIFIRSRRRYGFDQSMYICPYMILEYIENVSWFYDCGDVFGLHRVLFDMDKNPLYKGHWKYDPLKMPRDILWRGVTWDQILRSFQ
jgi:hypothetical protein